MLRQYIITRDYSCLRVAMYIAFVRTGNQDNARPTIIVGLSTFGLCNILIPSINTDSLCIQILKLVPHSDNRSLVLYIC